MDVDIGPADDAFEDFSLREASQRYAVELTTLQGLVRRGGIDAYKGRGPWGREWRVTRMALEDLGYTPRTICTCAEGDAGEGMARLDDELRTARRAAAALRRRAETADRRLGEALMEVGRLRAALAAVQGRLDEDALTVVDLAALRTAMVDVAGPRRCGDAGWTGSS